MTLLQGDCLEKLKDIKSQSVDMVYLDPPFYSQKTHSSKSRDNSLEYSFEDKWESIDDYMNFMKLRLIECHRVIKSTGSIFLHCDKSASHYLRILLDGIFGFDNFRSEIIWSYRRWSNSKKGLLNSHQTIYFYSKTADFKFNTIYTDYSPTTNIDQILQERERDQNGKSVYKKDANGNVILGKGKKGVPLSDIWEIPYLNPKATERTGYPTQKPILLLEQVIKISTDENDIILDPFCGSGTTLVAAKLLNRQFIGIDILDTAMQLSQSRLDKPIKTESLLLIKGQDDYLQKTEEELNILKSLGAIPVQRNNGIDGFLNDNYLGRPVAIKIQKPYETLNEAKEMLIKASLTKGCIIKLLIQTNMLEQSVIDLYNTTDENLFIVDKYNIAIEKIIRNLKKQKNQKTI
jgi:site-specific DNA-methyltransferase (adenine-specific)